MTVDERPLADADPRVEVPIDAPEPVDVAGIPDAGLRSAMEFAVGIAAAGQKIRPPLAFPPGLKPYLRLNRLDRPSLAAARRAVAGDDVFRTRLGEVATDELVDEIGLTWLRRGEQWQERVRELHRLAKEEADNLTTEAALRRAERRREAAEHVAARANAELIGHNDNLAREQVRRERAEQAAAASAAEAASARNEIAGLRREVERLRQRTESERARADRAEHAHTEALEQLSVVEALRDEILATRAVVAPVRGDEASAGGSTAAADAATTNRIAAKALQQAAAATRDLANALATAGEALAVPAASPMTFATTPQRSGRPRTSPRKPIAIPGGVYGDSLAAATHLLRTPQVVTIVDGYNVAKLAWPSLELIDQRERCIELLEDLARRNGTEIRVVFDGADVVGASAGRRLIRVQYSPAGVIADDVIRAEVRALPAATPVLVVTNDQAIVTDVRAEGANCISSDMLLAVGGRSLQR